MKSRFACLLLLLAASCHRTHPPHVSAAHNEAASPTNAEVLTYLAGKTLPVEPTGAKPLVIRQEGIEALSVKRDNVQSADGLWSTPISFRYNSTRARYEVEAVIEHQPVGAQRVFYSFKVKHVTRP